jgi:glycine betaine catabolism B
MPAITDTAAAQPASSGPKWIGGSMPAARQGLILNLFVPLVFLIADAFDGKLGADPVKEAIHTTGLVAVTFLVASLAVTPLKMVTGWGWLIQFRRSVGVFAFYYACAHLAIYFWWDRERSLSSTVYEITHRYYLMIGFLSLALMLPLWATSFNAAIKFLGGKRWKQLHRLAYLAAGLACWHFYLQTKADKRRPEIYITVLGGLLLWRVIAYLAQRRSVRDLVSVRDQAGSK